MVIELTKKSSTSARKDPGRVEAERMRPVINSHLGISDVEYPRRTPTIKHDAQMPTPPPLTSSSVDHPRRRSYQHNDLPTIATLDDDLSSCESSPEAEVTSTEHPPAKRHVHSSQRNPKSSTPACISSPPPPSTSTVPSQPHSSQSFLIPTNNKPPVSKKRKVRLTRPYRLPFSPAISEAPTTREGLDDLPILEYDLDKDPTQEVYEFRDQFHEQSTLSAMLSARFIHAHLFERLSGSMTVGDEAINNKGNAMVESVEPPVMDSVDPPNEVTPTRTLESAGVFGSPHPPPGYCDLDFGDAAHVTDQFVVPTMDDVINHRPWGLETETMIDPSLLVGTSTFRDPRSPSPTSPLRDLHSWKRTRTPSPSFTQSASTTRVSQRDSASKLNATNATGNPEGSSGGGKAKFYKKGALQTPPHLSNSQNRRSTSAKTIEGTQASYPPSSYYVVPPEVYSPLTDLSISEMFASGSGSTPSISTPSELVDEDAIIVGSRSGTPALRLNGAKTAAARKQKNTNNKGPYRTVALNAKSFCHQCRNSTTNPKMHCHTCSKLYCVLCIVKRYYDIEFHQFKKDFSCPSCLNKCNCTNCCDKRNEVYISSRHVRIDKETMDGLLSGEIRSLPHLSAPISGPRTAPRPGQGRISLSHGPPPSVRKPKAPARRKSQRYASDDDDDDDYYDDHSDYGKRKTSKAHNTSARVKPIQAALQTQRMLEESGGGGCWGAVYSISGERIGMSFVDNNLQDIAIQTTDVPTASIIDSSSFRRKRVYVGKWQDSWGFCPETWEDSRSEGEADANKHGGNKKGPSRAPFHYVGNKSVIKAWRKARFKTVQLPPAVPLPPSDGVDAPLPPSDSLPLSNARDHHQATGAHPAADAPVNEDDGGSRSHWIIEDGLSPERTSLPPLAATNVPRPSLGDVGDILDLHSTPTSESREELLTQEALAEIVFSSLEAVGTTVLVPQPPPSLSSLSC